MKLILILFGYILIAVAIPFANGKECADPNAEFSICGSPCPTTCQKGKVTCIKSCEAKCVCKDGFILDDVSGRCVRPQECPVCQDPNSRYTDCGSACPPTCQRENATCPAVCVPGCFCKEGYIFDQISGKCVRRSKCQVCTDPNTEFSDCGSPCPLTCQGRNDVCLTICIPRCVCKDGYVLNNQTGRCVLPQQCPVSKCKDPNAVFSTCGSACPDTCRQRDAICPAICVPKCICKHGYILDDVSGKCIRLQECPVPPVCKDPNAVFKTCGSACPPTCLERNQLCPAICVPRCVCRDGFILDDETGRCVRLRDCPECRGDRNAKFNPCGTLCPPTCQQKEVDFICPEVCAPGCECKKGYILDEISNTCVPPRVCPHHLI